MTGAALWENEWRQCRTFRIFAGSVSTSANGPQRAHSNAATQSKVSNNHILSSKSKCLDGWNKVCSVVFCQVKLWIVCAKRCTVQMAAIVKQIAAMATWVARHASPFIRRIR